MTLLFARTGLLLKNPSICTSRICMRIDYLSVCLSVCMSICLSVCQRISFSTNLCLEIGLLSAAHCLSSAPHKGMLQDYILLKVVGLGLG